MEIDRNLRPDVDHRSRIVEGHGAGFSPFQKEAYEDCMKSPKSKPGESCGHGTITFTHVKSGDPLPGQPKDQGAGGLPAGAPMPFPLPGDHSRVGK